jgi:hypothetical protein
MNLDQLKLFPNQTTDGDPNECVALAIVDVCSNADGRAYDPDFTYAMEPRLTGAAPTNGGRDTLTSMSATVAYGLLPMAEATFTTKPVSTLPQASDTYVANYQNYSAQQLQDALKYARKGIRYLYSYEDISGYLSAYKLGVVLTIRWYDSFNLTPATGTLPAPQGSFTSHAVAVYEDNGTLRIKPFKGSAFGDGGYCYLSPALFAQIFQSAFGFDPNAIRIVGLLSIAAQYRPYLATYLPGVIAAALTAPVTIPPAPPTAPVTSQKPATATPALAPPPTPTPANPDVLTQDWTTRQGIYHNVRVLCDLAGLILDEKNTICACIYQESTFYNYLPNGAPVKHENLNADGSLSSTDWGLCQINDYFHIGTGKDFPTVDYVLQNPKEVVEWMIEMYQSGDLAQWDSFKSGAYRQWLLPTSPMWKLSA